MTPAAPRWSLQSLLGGMTPEKWHALSICVGYAAFSTFLSMLYKAILSEYEFQASFILLACQVSVGLAFCLLALYVLPPMPFLELKPFDMDTFRA